MIIASKYLPLLMLWIVTWYNALGMIVTDIYPFGSEITNLDIKSGVSAEDLVIIKEKLIQRKVLVFRDQKHFTVESLRNFSSLFGKLLVHGDSNSHFQGYPDVNLVSNIKNESTGRYIGLNGLEVDLFHSDMSWSVSPAKITTVYGELIPDSCGDTVFLNTVMGYHLLNHTFQNQLNGLYGVYSYLKLRPIINGSYDGLTDEQVAKMNGTLHPLITMHPETGERNIYANPAHTLYIVNNTLDRGAAGDDILRDLFEIASRPEVTYRHKWRPDDLVMWDNRGAHHRATGCPPDKLRKLVRTTSGLEDIPREEVNLTCTTSGPSSSISSAA